MCLSLCLRLCLAIVELPTSHPAISQMQAAGGTSVRRTSGGSSGGGQPNLCNRVGSGEEVRDRVGWTLEKMVAPIISKDADCGEGDPPRVLVRP